MGPNRIALGPFCVWVRLQGARRYARVLETVQNGSKSIHFEQFSGRGPATVQKFQIIPFRIILSRGAETVQNNSKSVHFVQFSGRARKPSGMVLNRFISDDFRAGARKPSRLVPNRPIANNFRAGARKPSRMASNRSIWDHFRAGARKPSSSKSVHLGPF